MLRSMLRAGPLLAVGLSLVNACSSDSAETGSKSSGGTSGTGGAAAGTAPDAAGATGGTGGAAGLGGAGPGGAAGSSGAGASAGAGGDAGAAGSSGSGGVAVDASTDGGGGSDAATDAPVDVACAAGTKRCGGSCVGVDDPAFGCVDTTCSPCSIAGGTATCAAGACTLTGCAPGFGDCNGVAADGCEVDLLDDPANCGACGNACLVANATASCDAGLCAVAACDAGFDDCDSDPLTGCESDTTKDPQNCGTCSMACVPGGGATPACRAGACGSMLCPIGLADCDDDFTNGCETNLGSSAANCGYCGRSCDLPNATATCNGGVCRVATCDAGFEDCDGNPANGCEADVSTNALHCGACGRACVTGDNTSARCAAGTCFALCNAGVGDCVHPPSPAPDDGCETPTASDVSNCGACGNACVTPTGTPACNAGVCAIGDCPGGTGDCDGQIANGCETNLATTADHCGACGRACSNTNVVVRTCLAAACVSACASGFGNCTQPAAPAADDGCERDVSSDVQNCGACGRVCSGANVLSRECAAGVCSSACKIGFANCDTPAGGAADDGCEVTFTLASLACGSCANDCSKQGGGGSGLKCSVPVTQHCGCAGNDGRCRTGGSGGTCDVTTLTCRCGGAVCQPGEACAPGGGGDVCQCNGGVACAPGRICCQTPAGCRDVATDPSSCGACGRRCPPSFDCTAGACTCSTDASCDAGSSGSCNAGVCTCGAVPCAEGQRCQADGSCG